MYNAIKRGHFEIHSEVLLSREKYEDFFVIFGCYEKVQILFKVNKTGITKTQNLEY